jgi:hypothetical protein
MPSEPVANFISRWSAAGASERANYVLFLTELCDLLGVPQPDPAADDSAHNAYVFERAVTFHHRDGKTSTGRIDLYRRGCFVLEAKQYAAAPEDRSLSLNLSLSPADGPAARSPKIARGTAAWDDAMLKALGQADRYARSLPADEDPPPFLLVVDVGHVIELHADFTQKGKNYQPFPDARSCRLRLADLARDDVRALLRAVWTQPLSLDPAKKSAAVTREVAAVLAELAKSFEARHDPKLVAEFLSRCLFCMFAEDIGLLPKEGFKHFLDSIKDDPGSFVPLAEQLFADMNEGRVSGLLRKKLLYFNGGLFADARALPVNGTQLGLLRAAASLEWRHVEPAIFGTLLERALSPAERHKLGAHYTPRAYVERLVLPTLIEPLREEWSGVRIAAVTLAQRGTDADLKKARATVRTFHDALCRLRVLDPACGSGNFLYVALEQMKRLEGEVITLLRDLGETDVLALQGVTVDPHQFLGLELNPRAAAIAELVLWIGYLQWHFRVHGDALPAEPVLRKFHNIECRDAVLAHDGEELARDEHGQVRYVWDRRTTKTDPVTGRDIPDEKAVVPLRTYKNPRPAAWPQADYIIGNPPYIGVRRLKTTVGDGYVEALWAAFPDVPETSDFVMYWWHLAALQVRAGRVRRFGFITTNSITQEYSRRLISTHLTGPNSLKLIFAIADHPWVDEADGAAVRVAMTAASSGKENVAPKIGTAVGETDVVRFAETPKIAADLKAASASASATKELQANQRICFQGVVPAGDGFKIDEGAFAALEIQKRKLPSYVRRYFIGRDLVQQPEQRYILDFFDYDLASVRDTAPAAYQWLLNRVKPERDQNKRASYRDKWWIFAEPRPAMRAALKGLRRYIVTPYTAKHRPFIFIEGDALPDAMAYAIASDDAFFLGTLSSRIHVVFALSAGGRLGVGNDPRYTSNQTFLPFPFPDCTEKQKERIRALAEELDAHRKRAQQQHHLGLTDIYNVLEKLRAANVRDGEVVSSGLTAPTQDAGAANGIRTPEALTPKERAIHDAALVSTLKQLHDDLDRAVADAYGWPWPMTDAEILERVVALNAQRAAEEAQGKIRWLRPDYQMPLLAPAQEQSALALTDDTAAKPRGKKKRPSGAPPSALRSPRAKAPWPASLAERAKAIETALANAETPQTAEQLAKLFTRAKPSDVQEILETLTALGQAHESDTKGTYVR